jgi:hypothetical protein
MRLPWRRLDDPGTASAENAIISDLSLECGSYDVNLANMKLIT